MLVSTSYMDKSLFLEDDNTPMKAASTDDEELFVALAITSSKVDLIIEKEASSMPCMVRLKYNSTVFGVSRNSINASFTVKYVYGDAYKMVKNHK